MTTFTYRELQAALKGLPECEVARNKNWATLAAEYTRITGTEVTKAPTKGGAKSAKTPFDWEGYAESRKCAVKTLKLFRSQGHNVPKLNATNAVLLAALKALPTGAEPAPAPKTPTTPTKPAPKANPAPHGWTRRKGKLVARKAPVKQAATVPAKAAPATPTPNAPERVAQAAETAVQRAIQGITTPATPKPEPTPWTLPGPANHCVIGG